MDFLVVAFVICAVYSEYIAEHTVFKGFHKGQLSRMQNSNYSLAKNLFGIKIIHVIFPYLLAKNFIHSKGMSVSFAKRFVFILFVIVLISVYEMRMTVNLFNNLFGLFFEEQGIKELGFRYGLLRISGPFFHPLFFGTFIAVALLLNYWLMKNKIWKYKFSNLPNMPISKGTIIFLVLLFGLVMTLSRGPWLSCFMGFIIIGVGFSRKRTWSLLARIFMYVCLFFAAISYAKYYANVDPGSTETHQAGTSAYRMKIFLEYISVIMQKPFWGWGTMLWPMKPGMKSIDNQYLWLALNHGLVTLSIFLYMIFSSMIRLLKRGMKNSRNLESDTSLAFTLLAVFVTLFTSFVTVFMNFNIEVLFFLLLGWSEGYLKTKPYDLKFKIPKTHPSNALEISRSEYIHVST